MDSQSSPLLIAGTKSRLSLDQVIVGSAQRAPDVIGVLVLWPGDSFEVRHPVRVIAEPSIPPSLVVSKSLAAQVGLSDDIEIPWRLEIGFVPEVTARAITVISMGGADAASPEKLASSSQVDGKLIYVRGRSQEETAITIDGQPYRLTKIEPYVDGPAVYVIRTGQTRVTFVSPSNGAGVDVVVLADCSGSMQVADLPVVTGETVRPNDEPRGLGRLFGQRAQRTATPSYMTRIQAVRDALTQFAERRRQSVDSVSRVALVGFGSNAYLVYPESGMEEIDSNISSVRFCKLIDKIATLSARDDGTNIALALQFAASHLSNYGRPGNRRLIVLLSDGADWTPRGEDATGEMLSSATEDPISLMAHLNRSMNIQLHAIGISNQELYTAHCVRENWRPQPGLTPNHRLLKALLEVGGGASAHIGDAQVLEAYFRELGAGVAQEIQIKPSNREMPTLAPEDMLSVRRIVQTKQRGAASKMQSEVHDSDWATSVDRMRKLYERCNEKALRIGGKHLWSPDYLTAQRRFDDLRHVTTDGRSVHLLVVSLYQLIDEYLPSHIRKWKPGTKLGTALDEAIAQALHESPLFAKLNVMRQRSVHVAGSSKESVERSYTEESDAYEFFSGVRHIDEYDHAGWHRLGMALINKTSQALEELNKVIDRFNLPTDHQPREANEQHSTQVTVGDVNHVVVEW